MTELTVVLFTTPSAHLPEVDGPAWFGMPVLDALASGLSALGIATTRGEQYEDSDGGFLCQRGDQTWSVHLVFSDEDESTVTWAAIVDARTGCFRLTRVAPECLRPALAALHSVLLDEDSYRLLGWYAEMPGSDRGDVRDAAPEPFDGWSACVPTPS